MSTDADYNGSIRDLSTWTIEHLEAFAAGQRVQGLERVRIIAQSRAYRAHQPRLVRLRWARLYLRANERLPGDGPWDQARRARQEFALRTWIIEHLGPDTEPAWDPEALVADTLAALTLDPGQVRTISAGWRDLPIEQIGELRRHKNLTAHLDRLVDFLPPGPTKERLFAWIAVREHLP
ncbi:hypothetical protein ACFWDI_27530 [Streptomyces sp. NPDC060064]|uniref:hypothetical protein n=1 Tax=Streptomyces sp. NPDC060064 TaxID=3347049 RepID=UPI0036AA33C3